MRNKENFDKGYNPDDNLYYNILEHYTKITNNNSNKDEKDEDVTDAPIEQTKTDSVQNGKWA